MTSATPRLLTVLCLLLGLMDRLVDGRDDVLSAIPTDAVGFAVIHNLSDANRDIGELAKLIQAPPPDLLNLAKGMTGLAKGIDEQGDLAIVLTSIEAAPKYVVLAPVTGFEAFFAALEVKDPVPEIVDVQLAGKPSLIGRKGTFAVIAPASERDALEQFLASKTNLSSDTSLSKWLAANRMSVVLTTHGIKQVVPKILNGIRVMQEQVRKVGGENGQTAAEAFGLYRDLFTASEKEVEQFSVGVRIDSGQTVDFASRVQFKEGGKWSNWAAKSKPAAEDLLGGLEAKPFVVAIGGNVPQEVVKELMKMSVKMMQSQSGNKITPEQAQKYAEQSTRAMAGVKSMRMLMGVTEPGTGLYGNTTMVTTVDSSKGYLDAYEKSLESMREVAEEAKSPAIPVATSKRIKVGELEALEVSMTFPNLKELAPAGAPDQQKIMELFVGPEGKLMTYAAPADEHTVVMAYVSADRLKEAIEFYKSKKPGLSADEGVAQVAAKLPAGSQLVAYVSLDGVVKTAKQVMAKVPGARLEAIPDFPNSPPMGYAAKVSTGGIEGHMVVTAKTIRTIGDAVAKARTDAQERLQQQQ